MSRADTTARKRGRPSRLETDVGRDILIKVAREIFSTVEPTLVTRQMIAERAGVDANLIRYYFGDMRQLMAEVIADTHRNGQLEMAEVRSKDALARLRARVDRTFKMFSDNPHHHKMVCATLYDDENSESHDEWVRILRESLNDLADIIDNGDQEGKTRKVDARFLHFLIISAAEFWSANEPVVRVVFGDSTTKLRAAYSEFVYDLIINGLAPRLPARVSRGEGS